MDRIEGRHARRPAGIPRAAAAALLLAAGTALAAGSALDEMVAAERAFARDSGELGTRAAFLTHLAPEAVLFRAGPVNGIRLWQARGESPAVLAWAPSFAEVSGSGDFGFSSGPWTYAAGRDTAPAAFGHFVSVWRREAGGPWKVVLDVGISHPDPGVALERVEVTPGPTHAPPESLRLRGWDAGVGVRRGGTAIGLGTGGVGIGVGSGGFGMGLAGGGLESRGDLEWRRMRHEKNRLLTAERTFAFEVRNRGWESGYRKVSAGDLRVYREGRAPELGPDAAIEWSAGVPRDREWRPMGHAVAPSRDLAYVYGIALARGAAPDTAAYVHLWRKDDAGEWRMMLDIENPYPKR